MRATYKENMRDLINAWNTGPGADEQIDATGVGDAAAASDSWIRWLILEAKCSYLENAQLESYEILYSGLL